MADEVAPKTLGASHVTMFEVVTSQHADARRNLDVGSILKWMDICACLSAESHAHKNCVTLQMDDLHVEQQAPVGSTVRLDAQINKVFGSSMEVQCNVVVEPQGGRHTSAAALICSACFTFVALQDNGRPCKVDPASPVTLEERFASVLAQERKRWRQLRQELEAETVANLASSGRGRTTGGGGATSSTTVEGGGGSGETTSTSAEGPEASEGPLALAAEVIESEQPVVGCFGRRRAPDGLAAALPPGSSSKDAASPLEPHLMHITMTQLVLPHHANHHGNTFGGQLMAWMAQAATVVTTRYAQQRVIWRHSRMVADLAVSVAIFDAMKFLKPSKVGDRVTLIASITRVFNSSLEVSVDVTATSVESHEPQLINSGFITMSIVDKRSGRTLSLPPSAAPDGVGDGDGSEAAAAAASLHREALVRRQLRIQRRQMFSLRADPMQWSAILKDELCICNLMGLMRLAHAKSVEWELVLDLQKGELLHGRRSLIKRASMTGGGVGTGGDMSLRVFLSRDTFGISSWSLRCEVYLNAPIQKVFEHVVNLNLRLGWDSLLREGHVHSAIDEHNSLLSMVVAPIARGFGSHDYALLQSWKRDEEDGSYLVASRSVVHHEMPPTKEHKRGAVLPSGFLLEPVEGRMYGRGAEDGDGGSTKLTYVVQLRPLFVATGKRVAKRVTDAFARAAARKMTRRFERLQSMLHGVQLQRAKESDVELTRAGTGTGEAEAPEQPSVATMLDQCV